jgi:predicted nucleic acid-binding protein
METVMVDTSAVYALLDRSDSNHGQAVSFFKRLADKGRTVLLTNFIVAECHALILSRLGHDLAREWLRNMVWPVERVTEKDEERAREILLAYTDKSFSYVDAMTFAVMERLGVKEALAFDEHFVQFGFPCRD